MVDTDEALQPVALMSARHSEEMHRERIEAIKGLMHHADQAVEGLLGLAGAVAQNPAITGPQAKALKSVAVLLQHVHLGSAEQAVALATEATAEVMGALEEVATLSTETARRLGELLEQADA